MTSTGGYNPMRWNCKARGKCWNLEHRFNIEYFAHSLPRNISMMDVDATVEVNGHFLFLEFKSPGAPLPTGQRIYFERITAISSRITVCVVDGICRTSEVNRVKVFYGGKSGDWQPCDLQGLSDRVANWAANVDIQIVRGESAA